jgi:hypothetical protein
VSESVPWAAGGSDKDVKIFGVRRCSWVFIAVPGQRRLQFCRSVSIPIENGTGATVVPFFSAQLVDAELCNFCGTGISCEKYLIFDGDSEFNGKEVRGRSQGMVQFTGSILRLQAPCFFRAGTGVPYN